MGIPAPDAACRGSCTARAARGSGTAAAMPSAALPLVAVSLMAGRAGLLPPARSLAGLGGSWARSAAMASLAAATAGGGAGGAMPQLGAAEQLTADRGRRGAGLAPALTAAAAAGGQPKVAAAGAVPAAELPQAAMPSPPSSSRGLASMAAWLSAVSRATPSFRRACNVRVKTGGGHELACIGPSALGSAAVNRSLHTAATLDAHSLLVMQSLPHHLQRLCIRQEAALQRLHRRFVLPLQCRRALRQHPRLLIPHNLQLLER